MFSAQVVRANPDALVVDPGPLEEAMRASNTNAVLFLCRTEGRSRKPRKKGWTQKIFISVVHTDFFAARPEATSRAEIQAPRPLRFGTDFLDARRGDAKRTCRVQEGFATWLRIMHQDGLS